MYKRYKNYVTSNDYSDDSEIKESNKEEIVKDEILNDKNYDDNNINKFRHDNMKENTTIKKVIYCQPCEKRLETNQDYLLHMTSKKHKNKMKELLKMEIKECGSIKKALIKENMIYKYRRWKVNNVRYLLYGFVLNRYLKD